MSDPHQVAAQMAEAENRKRQREALQPEFRGIMALEQIADALDALRLDVSQIKIFLAASGRR
jgi:hypothetical protein